jgi:hypothetical protein
MSVCGCVNLSWFAALLREMIPKAFKKAICNLFMTSRCKFDIFKKKRPVHVGEPDAPAVPH